MSCLFCVYCFGPIEDENDAVLLPFSPHQVVSFHTDWFVIDTLFSSSYECYCEKCSILQRALQSLIDGSYKVSLTIWSLITRLEFIPRRSKQSWLQLFQTRQKKTILVLSVSIVLQIDCYYPVIIVSAMNVYWIGEGTLYERNTKALSVVSADKQYKK